MPPARNTNRFVYLNKGNCVVMRSDDFRPGCICPIQMGYIRVRGKKSMQGVILQSKTPPVERSAATMVLSNQVLVETSTIKETKVEGHP